MLGGDVGVGGGALEQARVLVEGAEGGVELVGGDFEGFRGVFVGLFPDFPDLSMSAGWRRGIAGGKETYLVYPPVCQWQ